MHRYKEIKQQNTLQEHLARQNYLVPSYVYGIHVHR